MLLPCRLLTIKFILATCLFEPWKNPLFCVFRLRIVCYFFNFLLVVLVYSLDQFSPIYYTCSLLFLLVLHTYLSYIRLSIIHYYTHINIQTIQSFSLSHFILLTWYQSHSSDFLVPVGISGVLPLPSPSSSRHCQKRATAVTPTVLQIGRAHV